MQVIFNEYQSIIISAHLQNFLIKFTCLLICLKIFSGSWAISLFEDLVYELVMAERVGGLLLDEYIEFPVGGIDDDVAWTGFMWLDNYQSFVDEMFQFFIVPQE
jgi:hypothetical protein